MTETTAEESPPAEEITETETFTETITVTERPVRYLTNRGEDTHVLEADLPAVTNEHVVDDEVDPSTRPQTTGMVGDYTYQPGHDPAEHEMSTAGLHDKEVPRHDRYAAENTGIVPQRVIPGGITNAHPDFTVGGVMDPTLPAEDAVLVSAPIPDDAVVKENTGAVTPAADATATLTGEATAQTGVLNPPVVSPEPIVTGPDTVENAAQGEGVPPRQVVQTAPDPEGLPPGPVPDGTVLSSVGDADTTPVPEAEVPEPAEPMSGSGELTVDSSPSSGDPAPDPEPTPVDSAPTEAAADSGPATDPTPEPAPEPGPADIPPPPEMPTEPEATPPAGE